MERSESRKSQAAHLRGVSPGADSAAAMVRNERLADREPSDSLADLNLPEDSERVLSEDFKRSFEDLAGEYGEFAGVAIVLLDGRKENNKAGKLKVKSGVDKALKDLLKLASDGAGFDSYEDLARTISLAASQKASLDGDTYEVLEAYEVAARLDPLAEDIVREYEYRKLRYESLVKRVESAKARKTKEGGSEK